MHAVLMALWLILNKNFPTDENTWSSVILDPGRLSGAFIANLNIFHTLL